MKNLISFGVVFILLGSCQDVKEVPKPKNLLEKEKMIEVLVDVALLQGARTYNRSLLEEKGIVPYDYLIEKHGVDSIRFKQSNDYYAAHYKEYQAIYDTVKVRLEALQKRYDSIRTIEERRKDSIEAVERDSIDAIRSRENKDSLRGGKDRIQLPPAVSRERSN